VLITSAEVFDEVLKQRLRTDLTVELFNFYGAVEVGRIAAECPAHEGLHVVADHVLLECLVGDKPAEEGVPGVVTLTCLDSSALPFIRYRLGDICTRLEKSCSCGSFFPLISPPQGRDRDMLRLPSGRLLSPMGLHSIVEHLPGIEQFRFIQESTSYIVLQLVMQQALPLQVRSQLQTRLLAHLQDPVQVDIQLVDSIRDNARKFNTFISKLPPADLW
jgi:phenylacetate-CoA ligase